MSAPIFRSTRGEFNRKNSAFKDMLMSHMAMDIEIAIKTTAGTPVDHGDMKAETRHFKSSRGGYRVETDKEYAAYQERGMRRDGSHIVRHYTTGGTGPGWFRRAIDGVWKNKNTYVSEAARALNL